MEFPGPDPETVALMSPDRPIPQDQMLPPEEMNRLLDPGNFETEIGWGMMDNGAGYIAMRHEMPGVTVDMVDWWFAWHPIEGLRYRIWYPPYHLGVHVDDWAQPRLLDPAVPVRDKCEKIVHHVTEDTRHGHRAHRHPLPHAGADGLRHEPLAQAQRGHLRRRVRLEPQRAPASGDPGGAGDHGPLHPRDRTAASSGARGSGWATRS